jgi:hypothetical protein
MQSESLESMTMQRIDRIMLANVYRGENSEQYLLMMLAFSKSQGFPLTQGWCEYALDNGHYTK